MTTEPTPVVLVADDEPSMLALVVQHMKTMGYEVLEASDGEQAWTLAREHLPDMVVLDVMMPGMSGWEVCRKIREDVGLAHTGVIMLTGIGENLNEMTSPLYGADTYIDKPFEFAELDEKVRSALLQRRAQRGTVPGLARTEPESYQSMGTESSEPPSFDDEAESPAESTRRASEMPPTRRESMARVADAKPKRAPGPKKGKKAKAAKPPAKAAKAIKAKKPAAKKPAKAKKPKPASAKKKSKPSKPAKKSVRKAPARKKAPLKKPKAKPKAKKAKAVKASRGKKVGKAKKAKGRKGRRGR